MTARRTSDDPRLPALYERRDALEKQRDAINAELGSIAREVLNILHPQGAAVVYRNPLHYRRASDVHVPMPASTAAALNFDDRVLPHAGHIEIVSRETQQEACVVLIGLGEEADEPQPATCGVFDDYHGSQQ